jgi:hypothetical protein
MPHGLIRKQSPTTRYSFEAHPALIESPLQLLRSFLSVPIRTIRGYFPTKDRLQPRINIPIKAEREGSGFHPLQVTRYSRGQSSRRSRAARRRAAPFAKRIPPSLPSVPIWEIRG